MEWSEGALRIGMKTFCSCLSLIQVVDRFHCPFNFPELHDVVKQHLSFLKMVVESAFQSFDFQGNERIMSKMGVSDRIVAERVFKEGDGCVVKDEVGEFMGGERGVGGRSGREIVVGG